MKILRLKQVLEKTGLKRSTMYQLAKDGKFPKQIKLGERSAGWIESEVESWIQSRIDATNR